MGGDEAGAGFADAGVDAAALGTAAVSVGVAPTDADGDAGGLAEAGSVGAGAATVGDAGVDPAGATAGSARECDEVQPPTMSTTAAPTATTARVRTEVITAPILSGRPAENRGAPRHHQTFTPRSCLRPLPRT